jgi:hypothetical protein
MRALGLLALAACASMTETQRNDWVQRPDYYSVDASGARLRRYSRIEQLVAYGEHGLGAQATIASAYESAQHAPPPEIETIVFAAELPPGITIDGRSVTVDPRAPYEPVAQFALGYWLEAAPQEPEIVDDLRRLASVTHGDAVVIEIEHVAPADARVKTVTGFVLHRRELAAAPPPVDHHHKARLAYRASGDGCLDDAAFARAITSQLGYEPWDRDAAATLTAEIRGHRTGFTATLQVDRANPRRLSGTTCAGVTSALIAIAVLQLDAP